MNYIKKLEQEVSGLQEIICDQLDRTTEFYAHLQTSKFDHPNNFINVEDVRRWLRYIEQGRN